MTISFLPTTQAKTSKPKATAEPGISFVQKVIKGETYLVMAQSAVQLEDEFSSLYYTAQNQSNIFLQPPFDPQALKNFVNTNNILGQCVEAMEVNIDGTGHQFTPVDEDQPTDKKEEDLATAFFKEPYPGMSFVKIRRKLRRELESVGYAYLEVLRNVSGDLMGLRNIETHNVRMVKLDAPVLVTKTLNRNGVDQEIQIWERERRFAQRVALKQLVYYREYGTSRKVSRTTGKWETADAPVPADDQGTELIMFGIHPDVTTPYFLPRWINQLPSVVGSRRAEEINLEFLDAGGMPPAIIFIQGGMLGKGVADQLKTYLSGQNKNKHRAVVVEAQSNSGSLEAAGQVQVKVERFGAERAMDAMFLKYDESTEAHIRVGFRIPPLFLGKAQDYNFATAQTSYMVAEEQVFGPERTEFDEQINMTLLKELGVKTLKFSSMPMVMKDMPTIIQALTIAKDSSSPDSFIAAINDITDLSLDAQEPPMPLVPGSVNPDTGQIVPGEDIQNAQHQATAATAEERVAAAQAAITAAKTGVPAVKPVAPEKPKTALDLFDLAQDYTSIKGLTKKRDFPKDEVQRVLDTVMKLEGKERKLFDSLVAAYTFGSSDPDIVALSGMAHRH